MPPESFLHRGTISKLLSRPLPTARKSMIRLSSKRTIGSCTPSLGLNSLA